MLKVNYVMEVEGVLDHFEGGSWFLSSVKSFLEDAGNSVIQLEVGCEGAIRGFVQ